MILILLGWCGSNSTCVAGNNSGPMGNCLRNSFLYSSPSSDWNPLKAGTINIASGGKMIITPEPNLRKIYVKN